MVKLSTKGLPTDQKELLALVNDAYKKLQGQTVLNKSTGITISFNRKGRNKSAGRFSSLEKSAVLLSLGICLQQAKKVGVKTVRKGSVIQREFPTALCVLNFKIETTIDGKSRKFMCGIVLLPDGKFQYSLQHNELKITK